jgi:hypothetical protein
MEYFSFSDISWIDIMGWIGGLEVLMAYWLISTKRVHETSIFYHMLNLTGAILLIINTVSIGAYPSAFVNIVWVAVAAYSIWKYRPKKNNSKF